MVGVKTPKPTYVEVLEDIAVMQAHLDRLETHILSLMNEFGITDEAIGTVQNLSSQRVGQKRRRQYNDATKKKPRA
jgi:hypothetical protein